MLISVDCPEACPHCQEDLLDEIDELLAQVRFKLVYEEGAVITVLDGHGGPQSFMICGREQPQYIHVGDQRIDVAPI